MLLPSTTLLLWGFPTRPTPICMTTLYRDCKMVRFLGSKIRKWWTCYVPFVRVSEWVRFNVPLNILQVISETSLSRQLIALVLTTKNNQTQHHIHQKHKRRTEKTVLANRTIYMLIWHGFYKLGVEPAQCMPWTTWESLGKLLTWHFRGSSDTAASIVQNWVFHLIKTKVSTFCRSKHLLGEQKACAMPFKVTQGHPLLCQ